MKNRILPFIIALSALSVSASAAFYSVTGLSKLFAGASLEVLIMASSLEISKLVIASLLYQYWNRINKLLRAYLAAACIILILITSIGIYGFLSAAYQETAALAGNLDAQIELIETKRDNVKGQLAVYTEEKTSVTTAISELRQGLSNNVIQYKDDEGNIITTTSSSTRRALENQLDQAIERQTVINSKIDILNTQLFDYETEIVETRNGNDIANELGPLKYLSGLTGAPMDKIINILLLIIIFVFDPLAISLVVAANFAFDQNKGHIVMKDTESNNKELDHLQDTADVISGGLTYDKDKSFAKFIKQQEAREEEWDEEHAHDMALNNAIGSLNDDDREWLENQIAKETELKKNKKPSNPRNSYWT